MSTAVTRVILTLAMLGSLPILYTMFFLFFDEVTDFSDDPALLLTNFIVGAYLVIAWIAIWFFNIKWNVLRAGLTGACLFVSLVAGVVAGLITAAVMRYGEEPAIIIGGAVGGIFWIGSTAIVWRETRLERMARMKKLGVSVIACPNCAFNLSGLSATNCPQCGSKFTLDQLFAGVLESRRDIHTD